MKLGKEGNNKNEKRSDEFLEEKSNKVKKPIAFPWEGVIMESRSKKVN